MPVTIQRETTEAKAPRVSARGDKLLGQGPKALAGLAGRLGTESCMALPERCQPKVMVRVAGRVESQREKRLPIMLPTSASK